MASKRSRQAFEADLQKQESPYVAYGTPLPPLDEHTRDDGSYVPVWKQEVTDERGRKRLHGAFTGGFSAGYFNTVGSKEGWTPSTFVSSRQNRNQDGKIANQQKPEDFMDEEDFREAEEARNLSTSDGFAGFGTTEQDTMRAAGIMDIFKAPGSTKGVQLLKRMGWKEGQGIGPKIRRKANMDDRESDTHLFAPENSTIISFLKKTDHKGLGYVGEARLEGPASGTVGKQRPTDLSDDEDPMRRNVALPSPKKSSVNQTGNRGFGVGILNDTGSDDEDPYEMGPKISYSKVIGGDKKAKRKKDFTRTSANPLVKTKPVFLSKKLLSVKSTAGFRKSHDGRLPLEGFVLADELDGFGSISIQDDEMKPPEVPSDWKSLKTPALHVDNASFVSTAEAAKFSKFDPKSRARLLDEDQLPGKSIFDFLTPATRDKLAAATGKSNLPQAGSEPAPAGYEAKEEDKQSHLLSLVPQLDAETAMQALSRGVGGWMPYAEDESKRTRYRSYLEIRAGLHDGLPPRASNSSEEDWVNEMQEFARAAQVFKPVTGLMASRFTSSSSQSTTARDAYDAQGEESLLTRPAAKPEDPAEAAAMIGMFGPLTRTVVNFYPTRLLCKRFNVTPPDNLDPGDGPGGQSSSSNQYAKRSQFEAYQSSASGGTATTPRARLSIKETASSEDASMEEIPMSKGVPEAALIDPDKNEALEKQRPGEAVFKAIFGSDDEEEDGA